VPLRKRRLKSKKLPTAVRVHARAKAIRQKRREKFQAPAKAEPIYWPDHIDEVRAIAMTGMTDDEMAISLGVKPELWESWKAFYPRFAEAIEAGRTNADAQVVAALHANAVGFKYITDEVVKTRKGAQVIQVEKRFLPETGAQKFWLTNRSSAWRQGQMVNVGGQRDGKPSDAVQHETKAMVIHSILNMIRPQPDNQTSARLRRQAPPPAR
jgi:hypothetical protein